MKAPRSRTQGLDVGRRCQARGIAVQAYAPLGSAGSPVLAHPEVVAVAAARGVGPAAVALRWAAQHGLGAVPKSADPARVAANAPGAVLGLLALTAEEMTRLDASSSDGTHPRRATRRRPAR
jgi:diketogulonate reductase-like aldo/keto reductase